MSRRSSSEDAVPDVWTALLFASVAAISVGIILLLLELNSYDNKTSSTGRSQAEAAAIC
jgi:hypothetical protein